MATYSENFLAALGLVAVRWARLEHEIKMHTSALAARDTDGWPIDDLEIGFKRLRKFWLRKLREHSSPERIAEAESMCENLKDLSHERALVVHSVWGRKKRGVYSMAIFRQNQEMTMNFPEVTPAQLRDLADAIEEAYEKLLIFTRGQHSNEGPLSFLI